MAIAYNIKPTKYPMNPDDLSELFDEAIEIAKDGMQEELVSGTNIKTINGNSLLGSGDLTIGGGATPSGYYAQYQDNITQTAAVANTGYPIKFRTLDYSNGVSVVSNSRITIANTGIYNLQFSVQLENSSSQEHDVTIWLRKNGIDVAGSAGFISVASSHGGVHGHVLSAWNYLIDAVGRDYYELVWSVSNTAVTMPYYPGALPPPSAASAIFTVTQQAGIMAGTGMTALNGLTDAVQTISTGTTGSDFNVASSGTIHTFNIPTASATKRGALSTADWSTFNGKEPSITTGTTSQYYRGDKTFQTLDKTAIGLGNVDNTSDSNKPVSTATSTALGLKQDTIVSGTTSQYYRGDKTFQTLDKSAVGLGNVDNTSDANKPVSTATSTALGLKQDTLVSGTNIKTVNGSSLLGSGNISVNSGVSLIAKKTMITQTGSSAIVLIASEDISSYIVSNSMIQVTAMYRKTVGASNYTPRLYVNTSATLVGATLIATFGTIGALNLINDNVANFAIDASGNLYAPSPALVSNTRYLNTLAGSVITIPSPCFLIWAGQLTNSADAAVMLNSNVIKYA